MHLSRTPGIALFCLMVIVIGGLFTLPGIYSAAPGIGIAATAGLIWTFCLLGALVAALSFLVTFAMDGFNMAQAAELNYRLIDLDEHRRARVEPMPSQTIERRAS